MLATFIAYALHRTRLNSSVTFCALFLLSRLMGRFPAARDSSSHCLFISAFMITSKVICDDTYLNNSWCIVGQGMFSRHELNVRLHAPVRSTPFHGHDTTRPLAHVLGSSPHSNKSPATSAIIHRHLARHEHKQLEPDRRLNTHIPATAFRTHQRGPHVTDPYRRPSITGRLRTGTTSPLVRQALARPRTYSDPAATPTPSCPGTSHLLSTQIPLVTRPRHSPTIETPPPLTSRTPRTASEPSIRLRNGWLRCFPVGPYARHNPVHPSST